LARAFVRAAVALVSVLVLVSVQAVTVPVAVAAPVSAGRSGWAWSDPLPQGESLAGLAFQGARGYAVGADGTVLRSDDSGAEWVGLASGTSANLDLVQELEAGVVVVGGGCTLRMSSDAGASFQRLPVNESEAHCASPIASFSFLSPSVGFVEQADGTISLTNDGGQTVVPRTAVPLAGAVAGPIAFASATLGLEVDGAGAIYRTTDGAGSWTKVASASQSLSDVIFVNPTTAYAVGAAGTMLASTDAGSTWTAMPLTLTLAPPAALPGLSAISCSDAMHCLMTTTASGGAASGALLRTEDGGATAALISPSTVGLTAVAFSSGSTAVAVGLGGATVLSADGGKSFPTQVSSTLGVSPRGPLRLGQSALDAYAPAAAGQLLASTNGGESWSLLRVPTAANMLDVAFPTTSVGYAVSEAGVLYRSPSAGLSWSILSAGGPVPAALLAPSPSTVLLVGRFGIRRSTDSGASFTAVGQQLVVGHRHRRAVKRAVSALELDATEQGGGAVVAYGRDAIVESSDGGASWSWVPVPFPHEAVEALDFVSASNGYAVAAHRLFHTADAGRHWQEMPAVASTVLGAIAFASPSEGYVLVARGGCGACTVLLHTADAGRSWTPEAMPRNVEYLTDGGSVAYASGAGSAGGLFETRDSGLSPTPSSLSLTVVGARTLSAAKLKRADGTVSLSGRLNPAQGGEAIEVAYRAASGGAWHRRTVTASSSGAFATKIAGIRTSTVFVAQWAGEGAESGAGTAAVTLTVTKPKKQPARAATDGKRT
jgi:photosystem II stability/assembly factor-like uncharacterized protein